MSPLRLLMGAGLCSLTLSGCIPAVAGLALQAVGLASGGGGGADGKGFRNPMDTHTSERAVREALSHINDRVDPACQAMLDAQRNAGQTGETGPGKDKSAAEATPVASAPVKPEDAPVNLLANVSPDLGEADVARAAETAPDAAAKPQPTPDAAPAAADAAKDTDAGGAAAAPVKVALASAETEAPGQCKHRLVCLPGTPKPTLMLMCPGKRDGKPAVAGETPDTVPTAAGKGPEQATAAAGSSAPASTAPTPLSPAAPSAAPAPVQTIDRGGVADWNWSQDPSKRL